jgi:hypothetical protein
MLTLEDTFLDELLDGWAVLDFRVECVLGRNHDGQSEAPVYHINIP